MLLFSFVLFLSKSTVTSQTTTYWPTSSLITTTEAAEEKLSPLQLVATPDYPIAAGQRVDMHCSAFTAPASVSWSWELWVNQTWQRVCIGRDLTLTEPEESGLYRCRAETLLYQTSESPSHQVYIISIHATVGENLGIAAFVISLVALIINFSVLFWLGRQKFSNIPTTSNTAPKAFPAPEKAPKACLPQTDGDGDVYMNYTSTNQAYTDLDPANMTGNNMYASLS
ncbi:hypothetical protein PAMA_003921 [Pampus argenteus]